MGTLKQFGETYRRQTSDAPPPGLCGICGSELESDAGTGEMHCPVCENPEE